MIQTKVVSKARHSFLFAVSAVLLMLTLTVPAAWAEDDSVTTITVYVPGAASAAPVAIQKETNAGWLIVASWQGNLTDSTSLGVPFTRWAVADDQLEAGPLRAVVYSLDKRSVVAVGEPFYAPPRRGINLAVTLGTSGTVVGQPFLIVSLGKTIPQPPRQAPILYATSSIETTACHKGDCGWAQISVYLNGLPLNSWVAVEWQNEQGEWLPVPNWEGQADRFGLSPQVYKIWDVYRALYCHGPFRWAIYTGADGGLLGVSPTFRLPTGDEQNLRMELSQ